MCFVVHVLGNAGRKIHTVYRYIHVAKVPGASQGEGGSGGGVARREGGFPMCVRDMEKARDRGKERMQQ